MKKLLAALVLLSLLLFAGVKVLIWFQVNAMLNNIKQVMVTQTALDWGWIASDLGGSVTISDLQVTPFFLKDTLLIEQIHVRFDGSLDLLGAAMQGNGLKMPPQYEVEIAGGHLPLSNRTFLSLQPNDPRYREVGPLAVYSCGDISQVTGKELLAMGYNELEFALNYAYSAPDALVRVRGQMDGVLELDASAKLGAGGAVDFSKGLLVEVLPMIRNLQTTIKDAGFFRRLSFLCGRLHGLSQHEYLQAAVNEWDEKLKHAGIVTGQGIRDTLLAYADAGVSMTVTLAPTPGAMKIFSSLFAEDAMPMSAATIISTFPSLGLHLASGTAGAAPMDIRFDQEPFGLFMMTRTELSAYLEEQAKANAKPPAAVELPGYKIINFAEIEKYPAEKIQVEVLTGKIYTGILTAVSETSIEVTEYLPGGSFAYRILNEDVFQVSIWR
jgi:hypothetical protein